LKSITDTNGVSLRQSGGQMCAIIQQLECHLLSMTALAVETMSRCELRP